MADLEIFQTVKLVMHLDMQPGYAQWLCTPKSTQGWHHRETSHTNHLARTEPPCRGA